MKFSAALLMMMASLAACTARSSTNPPRFVEIVFDCSEIVETPDGTFTAAPESVGWSKDLGDGFRLGGGAGLIGPEEQAGFVAAGIGAHRFVLFLDFPPRWRDLGRLNYGNDRGWNYEVWLEFRVGSRVIRRPSSSNVAGTIEWQVLRQMLGEGADDLVITLYNRNGSTYQRAVVPRDLFERVEQTLREMQSRAMNRQQDRERFCQREEEEVIILRH